MVCIVPRQSDFSSRVTDAASVAFLLRIALFMIAVGMFALLYATAAYGADPVRGRALYENHCQSCHTPKIHSRPNKLPLSKHEVRLIIDDWRRQVNLPWTPEEVEDVLEYLNDTRYHYAPR